MRRTTYPLRLVEPLRTDAGDRAHEDDLRPSWCVVTPTLIPGDNVPAKVQLEMMQEASDALAILEAAMPDDDGLKVAVGALAGALELRLEHAGDAR